MNLFNAVGLPLLFLICLLVGLAIKSPVARSGSAPPPPRVKLTPADTSTAVRLDIVPVEGSVSNYLDCEAVDPEGTRWLSRMGTWVRDPRFIVY